MKVRMVLLSLMFAGMQHLAAQGETEFCPRDFRLNVSQMLPSGYPSKAVSYGYSVAVRNDSAFVHLPYMGRVYRPVLNDDGLNFALPVDDFKVKEGKKGAKRVEFSVRKQSVRYDFALMVYPNGSADIFLHPDNAQSISYLADVSDEK